VGTISAFGRGDGSASTLTIHTNMLSTEVPCRAESGTVPAMGNLCEDAGLAVQDSSEDAMAHLVTVVSV
jgi:hypothetical protein